MNVTKKPYPVNIVCELTYNFNPKTKALDPNRAPSKVKVNVAHLDYIVPKLDIPIENLLSLALELPSIDDRDRIIIEERYLKHKSLDSVSQLTGISIERNRQLTIRGLEQLHDSGLTDILLPLLWPTVFEKEAKEPLLSNAWLKFLNNVNPLHYFENRTDWAIDLLTDERISDTLNILFNINYPSSLLYELDQAFENSEFKTIPV